uniref:glutamate--tRNA ligase n=1 Tax=Pararhizobium sp. IMCC3301 TaxID=3067904 RepID=UPI002741F19C|nr:glutamate--tRNA ligase [Pararhizobium sp. IMCC3301]
MSPPIITRFAPSPTGFLHIGGARTALFNWLFARANGGKMLLRIEDTDQSRSTPEAVTALMDGLNWLGIDWQGEAVSQFSRQQRHAEVANQLVSEGKAYHCYTSPEDLSAMREKARAENRAPKYDGTWRDRDPAEAPAGINPVVRIKAEQTGTTTVMDRVQGEVEFPNADLDDFILLRSDGTPTYMLAVVVDDHDMGITHIVRGDDHLTNAARQIQIYKALDWPVPVMAHVPLIHGPDGAKLSKRHGALGAEAYRAMGYLPEALCNYLVRLGWAHGDDEVISIEQMIEWFTLDAIGKSPSRFDFAKLENLNGIYIRAAEDQRLIDAIETVLPELEKPSLFGAKLSDIHRKQLLVAMPGLKERAKTVLQLIESAEFIAASVPLDYTEKALSLLDETGRGILSDLIPALKKSDWNAESLEIAVKAYADERELKLGKVAQPLRAALTGSHMSPGIYDVLLVLGREESLKRISAAIS